MEANLSKPMVLWFTGLSGSGKTTIAADLFDKIKKMGYKVEHLDGDKIRDKYPKIGFTKEDRDNHIKNVGGIASELEHNGAIVLATFISPYEETRRYVRNLCDNFIEIYIATDLSECERRDVKGLYKRARAGEIDNFTGISDPYEPPENPEIKIDTACISVDDASKQIMNYLERNNCL